jgi:hypothetical protein
MIRALVLTLVAGAVCLSAKANTVPYVVSVDTSSLSGSNGYIDFQLNQGTSTSLPVTAIISGFTGATLNPSDPLNDAIGATGALPGPLTIQAAPSTDYFEALTFGGSVNFNIQLQGSGVDPAGLAGGTSGTIFALSFFDASGSNPLLTTDPNGTVGVINVDADGTVSAAATPGGDGSHGVATFIKTPEPGTFALVGGSLAFLLLLRKRASV